MHRRCEFVGSSYNLYIQGVTTVANECKFIARALGGVKERTRPLIISTLHFKENVLSYGDFTWRSYRVLEFEGLKLIKLGFGWRLLIVYEIFNVKV